MTDARVLQEVLRLYDLVPGPAAEPYQAFGSGSGNSVCAVQTTADRIILRRSHASRTGEWLALEAAVLEYLARAGFPAVRQRRTPAGDAFVQHEGCFWTVFDYVEAGLATVPDDGQVAVLGQVQARLHQALAGFVAGERWASWARQPRLRKTWAYIVPLADTFGFLKDLAIEQRIGGTSPQSLVDAILAPIGECRRRLQEITRQLPLLPGMLTHSDYGQYNVLFGQNGAATVIDFDLLCWESAVANLARAISVVARRTWMGPFEPQRAGRYLAAYDSERRLSDPERAALPGLLRLYVLQYVIFHALLCIEESKGGAVDGWVQAMRDDLGRDDELVAGGAGWTCQPQSCHPKEGA